MANLTPGSGYTESIYRIETTDTDIGGEDGIENIQAKQLLGSQIALKGRIDGHDTKFTTNDTNIAALQGAIGSNRGTLFITAADQVPAAADAGKVVVLNGFNMKMPADSPAGYDEGDTFLIINVAAGSTPRTLAKVSGTFKYRGTTTATITVYPGDQYEVTLLGGSWYVFNKMPFVAPVGAMVYWPHTIRPDEATSGWFNCDGRNTLSKTQYPELFSIVAAQYGAGSDSSTFKIITAAGYLIRVK